MSWIARVHWSEGLFLRPHHLQQSDRYLASALESRALHVTSYPWGFSTLEIDGDLRDIQDFLSAQHGRRAIRLELVQLAAGRYISTIKDRTLFRKATFVLEVSARRPFTEIQQSLPAFLKIGPNTKMNEIVHAHLPGVPLVYLPTPPPQIRKITDHVYFYLKRTSPLWPEFSQATALGMHFAGDWPELQMELSAVKEDRG